MAADRFTRRSGPAAEAAEQALRILVRVLARRQAGHEARLVAAQTLQLTNS